MIAADCNLAGPIVLGIIGLGLAGYAFVSSLLVNREAREELRVSRRIRATNLRKLAEIEARERRPGSGGGIRQVPPE